MTDFETKTTESKYCLDFYFFLTLHLFQTPIFNPIFPL